MKKLLIEKRKFPKTDGVAVEQVLYKWFCMARNKNIPISGSLIKQKALETARNLNFENNAVSNGW